jgi:hypothetical protein
MKKKKRRITKGQYSRLHSKMRAQRRYGITLNREKYSEIVNAIKIGANRGRAVSNNRSLHIAEVDGVKMLVVYDKKRKELITVLPQSSYLYSTVEEA